MRFTVPFYHFLFSRYLHLTERHFLSYILVPFPDSSYLYSHAGAPNKESFDIENFLALEHFPQKKIQIDSSKIFMFKIEIDGGGMEDSKTFNFSQNHQIIILKKICIFWATLLF